MNRDHDPTFAERLARAERRLDAEELERAIEALTATRDAMLFDPLFTDDDHALIERALSAMTFGPPTLHEPPDQVEISHLCTSP